jgi:glucose-1-phosphate thymidylyltransferase
MNFKGIVLAGGSGKRLYPVTKVTNKHFLPIYDKPLIFYSLSILLLSKIKDILIICLDKDLKNYKDLLGDGSRFGISLSYKTQNKPRGIPDAFIIGETFINRSNVALVLGDNLFYGHQLTDKFLKAKLNNKNSTIFVYPVQNPSSYGIIELSNNKKIKSIREKPKKTKSNLAISGFYLFDNNVSTLAKKLKPSKRNEIEIVDLINIYSKKKKLKIEYLGRGSAWIDTGTFENLEKASSFIRNIEERQGLKVACLEEIALKNKWIKKIDIKKSIKFYGNCNYSSYLKKLIKKNENN